MTQGLLGKTALKTHTVIFFLKTILKNGGEETHSKFDVFCTHKIILLSLIL